MAYGKRWLCLVQQVLLRVVLELPVRLEWSALCRRSLGCRHFQRVPVDPDGPRVQQVSAPVASPAGSEDTQARSADVCIAILNAPSAARLKNSHTHSTERRGAMGLVP